MILRYTFMYTNITGVGVLQIEAVATIANPLFKLPSNMTLNTV